MLSPERAGPPLGSVDFGKTTGTLAGLGSGAGYGGIGPGPVQLDQPLAHARGSVALLSRDHEAAVAQ